VQLGVAEEGLELFGRPPLVDDEDEPVVDREAMMDGAGRLRALRDRVELVEAVGEGLPELLGVALHLS
jgi:hypothetical protein